MVNRVLILPVSRWRNWSSIIHTTLVNYSLFLGHLNTQFLLYIPQRFIKFKPFAFRFLFSSWFEHLSSIRHHTNCLDKLINSSKQPCQADIIIFISNLILQIFLLTYHASVTGDFIVKKKEEVPVLQIFIVLQRTCPGANNANVMEAIKEESQNVMRT